MSVCYDLRFPALYRRLAEAGAEILSVPSAFTVPTGAAHWHVLLRARAIETGCFVMAPAQVGAHENGRHTFGHSLIIDPWGQVLAEAMRTPPSLWRRLIWRKSVRRAARLPHWRMDAVLPCPMVAKRRIDRPNFVPVSRPCPYN